MASASDTDPKVEGSTSAAEGATKSATEPTEASAIPVTNNDDTMRELEQIEKDLRKGAGGSRPTVPRLDDICVSVLAEHFVDNPCLDDIPEQYVEQLLTQLDVPAIQASLNKMTHAITNEKFWEKMCKARWQSCQLEKHGSSWKRCYLERHLTETLEEYYPSQKNEDGEDVCYNALMEVVKSVAPYIHTVRARQLLAHPDLSKILCHFPNLSTVDITYGAADLAMNYDPALFGMKLTDALSLGRLLQNTRTINKLVLSECLINDETMHLLMSGLQANDTVVTLELPHNQISDVGAQRLAIWLGDETVLMSLNLCDNRIGPDGTRFLADAAAKNNSLRVIDLRLNKMGDEGVKTLLAALPASRHLRKLNVSSNGFGPDAIEAVIQFIGKAGSLTHLDISCNKCFRGDRDEELVARLFEALESNQTLEYFDARHTGLTRLQIKRVHEIVFPRAIATKRSHRHGFLNPRWQREFGKATAT